MLDWLKKHLSLLTQGRKIKFKNRLDENALAVLKKIGVKKDQKVIDFGCGLGTYSIPAAGTVGKDGRVFAVEVEHDKLRKVNEKANENDVKDIIDTVLVLEERDLPFKDKSVDHILLLDVLHEIDNKKKILSEFNRIISPEGNLTVYPMHIENPKVEKWAKSRGFELVEKLFEDNLLKFRKL